MNTSKRMAYLEKISNENLIRTSSKSEEYWNEILINLKDFREEFGRWPKSKEMYKNHNIGVWLYLQRTHYYRGNLGLKKYLALIGIGFEMKPLLTTWDIWLKGLEEIKSFLKKNRRLPEWSSDNKEEHRLAQWVIRSRSRMKKFQSGTLIKKHLEELGVGTKSIKSDHDKNFKTQLKNLISYRKKYPTNWPSKNEEFPKGNRLGFWCTKQRFREYPLELNRKKALQEIGFPFSVNDDRWEKYFRKIQLFKMEYGRLPNSKHLNKSEKSLYDWFVRQRGKYRKGKLSDVQIRRIKAVGMELN